MNALNWDLAKKNYPDVIKSIHEWFCKNINVDTKIWFYNQPIWRNELMPMYLRQVHGIKIMYDIAFDKKTNQFKFIYAIIDGDKAIPPQQVFSERIQAEQFAYAHVLEYIKKKNELVSDAEVVTQESNENNNKT